MIKFKFKTNWKRSEKYLNWFQGYSLGSIGEEKHHSIDKME